MRKLMYLMMSALIACSMVVAMETHEDANLLNKIQKMHSEAAQVVLQEAYDENQLDKDWMTKKWDAEQDKAKLLEEAVSEGKINKEWLNTELMKKKVLFEKLNEPFYK